jgi:hypothetical protein
MFMDALSYVVRCSRACELRRCPGSYVLAGHLQAQVDHDCSVPSAPPEFRRSETHWHWQVARSFDMHVLAHRARALFEGISPEVKLPILPPNKLSYFLVASIGLPASERYALFCTPNTVLRLQKVCFFLLVIAMHLKKPL